MVDKSEVNEKLLEACEKYKEASEKNTESVTVLHNWATALGKLARYTNVHTRYQF